jgi:hypothetical protein
LPGASGTIFPAIQVVGIAAEHIFGHRRWLLLDFVPGVFGEIAGYASTEWRGRLNGAAGFFETAPLGYAGTYWGHFAQVVRRKARYAARRAFGNTTLIKEEVRML